MNGGHEKGVWYVLESGPYNQALVGLSRDEIAEWAVSLGRALAKQVRGINAFADDLMDERDRYLEERRETGKMGGRPPKKGHPRVTLGSPGGDGGAVPYRTETEPDLKPEPKPKKPEQPRVGNNGLGIGKIIGGENSQDRYERIASLRHDELADYAADFCGEPGQPRTVAAFKRLIGIIGPEAFRSELDVFAEEVAAGEEPRNRGAAFMARLKKAVEAKVEERNRKAGA